MPSLIRPSSIDAERYLIWLFLRTEKKLVDEIVRKQTSGYVDYAEQAALKRVQGTLKDLEDESFTYVPRMVREAFIKTNKDLYGYSNAEALARISEAQNKAIELLTANLLGTITEAVAQTYESTKELMTIGRLENDPFRTGILSGAARSEALGTSSLTEVTKFVTELETEGITAFIDKAGRHWSLRDYGNMAIRTTKRQAEVSSLLTADDWDLWQIVKIGSTCPLCAVYEGRVYSKSGMNPNYPPLSMAFGKIDPAGGNDLSNTYLNIHPNCLHSLIKFTEMGKSDKQLQKIREFSSPITNPTNIDPRTKKQREAYNEKVKNRAKLLREMRQKEAKQIERESAKESRRARQVHNIEGLSKISKSSIINLETHEEVTDYFSNTHGISVTGFDNRSLFETVAVLAGYDDMLTEFPELSGTIKGIRFDESLKDCGRINLKTGLSRIGVPGLGDYGTGVHEAAHMLDFMRSPAFGESYSEQIVKQARKNLGIRINSKMYRNYAMQITADPKYLFRADEVFAYAMETAKGGVRNELADEIYRLAKGNP